jgi:hypothetical protein
MQHEEVVSVRLHYPYPKLLSGFRLNDVIEVYKRWFETFFSVPRLSKAKLSLCVITTP